ncbi:unnamed protein product [Allacma fusca]|uniref:DENN domain-containing protein 5B n=1 Tax=Allacma fusca TaxID=39272 RepID=A0A8J2KYU9_9HEXA|nr:unnamed protein product [Allacma fusca]
MNDELASCTPLDRSYKPKILAHYPENVPWNPFDQDAVRNLCLPSGLVFRTQKHRLEPCFHSFVITRENGSRTFGFSFVFYEEVKSKHVKSAIHTLQAMHVTELSSAKHYHLQRATQNRNIRNASVNLHHHQSPHGRGRAGYLSAEGNNTRSLPRHFKLAAHKQQSLSAQSFYDTKDSLFVTKAIALICPLPFIQAARHFLSGLYRYLRSGDDELSLESYVYHLLYYVPLPPPGRSVKMSYFGENITCPRPKSNELPLLDYPLGELFRLLDLDSVLQLFTCVLLENQILLYSKDLYRLMLVAECVTAVLFPFVWQHVYVPILPSTLHHFLDAPVPFIMGLHAQTTECKENIPCEANLCFVDIDNNIVQVPEDLPTFPQRSEFIDELSQILQKYNIPVGNITNKMSNNRGSPYRMKKHRGRKNSWSHDSDSGMSSNDEPLSLNGSQMNIASSTQYFSQASHLHEFDDALSKDDIHLKNLKLNNSIREIFFNRFVHVFSSYDHFLIHPDQDPGRMLIHNFDKATFLSDQPDQNLPFLSHFIETQMFATLIDRKIASMSGETDSNLAIFEQRIKVLRSLYGESLVRTPSYEPCSTIKETEQTLEKRFLNPDFIAPSVAEVSNEKIIYDISPGSFPILNVTLLNMSPTDTRNMKILKEGSSNEVILQEVSLPPANEYPSLRSVFQPKQTNSSPASIAQANWEFVKQLLQECKTKTKRMLVEKMGAEAVALGHGEVSISGVEENTLVASLCDLLERIWAHGLHVKQKGKSPLWNFLTNYQESEACKDSTKPIDPQFLTPVKAVKGRNETFTLPDFMLTVKSRDLSLITSYIAKAKMDLSAMAMELNLNVTSPGKPKDSTRRSPEKRERRSRAFELPVLKPLPVSVAFDMRNIQGITEIKTEIGYARAWIRLSLEKKVLSKHLRALLADDELLRGFYKRNAFLRSEEEREQFLYHLLTLNAVDYYCFTNTYTNIVLPYRVLIFPSKRFNVSTTTANVWVTVSGTLAETQTLSVPKNTLEFVFQHKNLGLPTTLHIGHDNSGVSPKWMVDYVIVRNEVTGQTSKFPCGRWLGRDIDDGSTERLLVGEQYYHHGQEQLIESRLTTPPRARSPSVPRRANESRMNVSDIQQSLSDSVNNIVKYYYKPDKEKGSLTVLLCGDTGLVSALEQVFLYGFKSTRLFGKNFYIWDYFVKVKEFFETVLQEEFGNLETASEEDDFHEQLAAMRSYCELIEKINSFAESLGKDGKFQLFICLCAREHLLHRFPAHMPSCPTTVQMYEEHSFIRDADLLSYLVQVLEPLDDFDIVLEHSLTKGIE